MRTFPLPKVFLTLPLFSLGLLLTSCDEEPSAPATEIAPASPAMNKMTKQNTGYYTGQVVEKTSLNKGGKPMAHPDLYLRLSMGDFFIKFCESAVSREDLADQIDQYIKVKGELKQGEWDTCPGDPPGVQSRVGDFFVITEWVR